MTHSHFGSGSTGSVGSPPMLDPDELRRHRRALRILVVVLIPLAIWTVVGLIVFWPGDISDRVNPDLAGGYNIPGVTYPSARITEVKEIACDGLPGSTPEVSELNCAEVVAELQEGDDRGLAVSVPLTEAVYSSGVEVGQVIKLTRVPPVDDQPAQYQFADFERRTPLIVLTVLFAVAVVAVARWRGFASLIGLAFAGFILVKFMFPALVAGSNPLLIGLIGSSAIMFVVLYAAHGFSARTSTALVGTLFGLILIALLGLAASRWAHLTGVASEEDFVLSAAAPDLRLTSVVLCGIIVAGLGVLNDVTITQASAVWELADEGQGQRHLFAKAMRIGRDHIASTVYTIAFATAGAALSVLLLISIYDRPLLQVVQTEQFAGEIIRTLVGSIGLVLAVPLTTAVGVAVVRASRSAVAPPRRQPRPVAAGAREPEREPLDDGAAQAVDADAARTRRTEADTGEQPVVSHAPDETGVLPATKWRTFGQEPTERPTPTA
ncbi:MAG TPA: YibE/F family protein, partial [Propionibacteriaceae bacterium]|nr:YibE/F family protein [Propionibacteriaceae bacterium]